MKNTVLIALIIFNLVSCKTDKTKLVDMENKTNLLIDQKSSENIYQFEVDDLDGYKFDFSALQGKKVMIVNTASECGNTPQYEQLQELYEKYKDKNFTIVGFPANNFGKQEPGTDMEIAKFCKLNYGVSFPMMSKISVKGDDMHEMYKFLTLKDKNGYADSEVAWNFQKYLIDKNGHVVRVIDPKMLPTETSIISWIEAE